MEVLHARCAGLDVHSRCVNACARIAAGRKVTTEHREFATTTAGLLALAAWLSEAGCTHVAMEATGVYWKPVWHILEDEESLTLVLANAQHIRNVPGRKSDRKDAAWIADLLAHGLIRGSFVPPAPIQELRDLTRTRKQLVRESARHTLRLQKTLEDANVKLTRVVTDILGVSGRAILAALIAGETDPERLADCTVVELQEVTFSGQRSTGLMTTCGLPSFRRVITVRTLAVALLLAELGLPSAIAAAFNEKDLDVVGQSVDQCDGARGVGKDGVPALEWEVGGDQQGAVLVAPTDELEDQVGGACVVGEISELIDDQQHWACVVPQAAFERAGGLLSVEVKQQVGGGGEESGVSGEDGLVGNVLRQHCFPQALRTNEDDVLATGEEIE